MDFLINAVASLVLLLFASLLVWGFFTLSAIAALTALGYWQIVCVTGGFGIMVKWGILDLSD